MPGTRHTDSLVHETLRRPHVAGGLLLSASTAAAVIAAAVPAGARDGLLQALPENEIVRLVEQGFIRHPSVMLAAVAALAVPVVALIAASSRFAATWRLRRNGMQEPVVPHVSHRSAWIEGPERQSPPTGVGEILRIGDSDDCDLALPGSGSGATCALIQRTADYEFFLFDVSGGEARLAVNGAPVASSRLRDGDRIDVGDACLVFRTGDAMPAPLEAESA